jgi:hypothetical protein
VQPIVVEHSSPLADGGAIVAGIGALIVISATIRELWRMTLGRRSDRYRRLSRLGTGAQLSFFTAVLGEPPAMSRTVLKADFKEFIGSDDPAFDPASEGSQERLVSRRFGVSTFIDRDYFVQVITDRDQTVIAYSVTARSNWFRPVLELPRRPGPITRLRWRRKFGPWRPVVRVTLGRTTFADLDPSNPDEFNGPHLRINMGAHNHAYSEIEYKGNPGYYQSFVWTASDAARQGRFGLGMSVQQEVGGDEWPNQDDASTGPEWQTMRDTQRFRRETVITTYTVIGPRLWLENYPLDRFGPWVDEVRTLA